MEKFWILIFLLTAHLLRPTVGMAQQDQLIKAGNYLHALKEEANDLAKKPDAKLKQKGFAKVYRDSYSRVLEKIDSLEEKIAVFRGEETLEEANRLIEVYSLLETIRKQIEGYELHEVEISKNEIVTIKFTDFSEKLTEATNRKTEILNLAAEMHYNAGTKLDAEGGQSGSKDHFKAAAREYARAIKLVPGFRDCQERYEASRANAIKRIMIMPFNNRSGQDQFGDLGSILATGVVVKLQADPSVMEFLDIVTEAEIRNALSQGGYASYDASLSSTTAQQLATSLNVEEIWMGDISQVIVPTPTVTDQGTKTKTMSIKVGERTVPIPDKPGKTRTENVYADMSATYKIYNVASTVEMRGSTSLIYADPKRAPVTQQFAKTDIWGDNYTTMISGTQEVYDSFMDPKAPLPSLGIRLNNMIEGQSNDIYKIIRQDVVDPEIPMTMNHTGTP
ncbi:MAG: hypothetical protein SF052_03175 [Bacteroidia bacterium]|nr:hypothetical protein [Bacteroidia bacterium]